MGNHHSTRGLRSVEIDIPAGGVPASGLGGNLRLLMHMEIDFKELLMNSLDDATLNSNHYGITVRVEDGGKKLQGGFQHRGPDL